MAKPAGQWESRIGRRIRLRDLHILFAVIQSGSMAKAAAELGMSQPSVSEAMADLEHAIGVRLLDRSPHGVAPTAYGRALSRRAKAAFDELRQGVEEIEHLADPAVGEIRVSCPETLTAGFLPAIIDQLSARYPRITFHVVQENRASRFRELRERNVDLALARLLEPLDADDLESEVIFDDKVHIVAGAAHRLARRRKINLAELVGEPWVSIPSDDLLATLLVEAFRGSGLPAPKSTVVTFSQHVRYHLLATGRFVTTLPASVLRFNAKHFALKVLPVKLLHQPRPVALIRLKHRTPSPVAQLFADAARHAAESLGLRDKRREQRREAREAL